MGFVHAGLVTLLRGAPHLIVEILIARGLLARRRYRIRSHPTEVFIPMLGRVSERRADLVLEIWPVGALDDEDGHWGIVVEIQLAIDPSKYASWSILYAAHRWGLGEHIFLVPFTLDTVVATWLREDVTARIENMQVCVVEPDRCPRWTDFSPDEEPERALLMAMVAVTADDQHDRLPPALRALEQIEGNNRVIYMEMLMSHFGEEMLMDAAQRVPVVDEEFEEMLRNYQPTERERGSFMYTRAQRAGREAGLAEGREEGRQQGRQEGRQEGLQEGRQEGLQEGQLVAQVRLVLMLLEQRGLAIPRRVRMRVLECSDPHQLDRWFERALHVEQADALFDEVRTRDPESR